MATPIISLQRVSRVYQMGHVLVPALDDVSLDVHEGEFVAIVGPSGSGKSTMMHILGCLDRPTAGAYVLAGDPGRRPRRRRPRASAQPDHRLRLPVVQPAAPHDRARQRRDAAALPGHRPGGADPTGRRRPGAAGHGRSRDPRADRAQRRPAAARGRGSGARDGARAHPRRRADRQPRQPLRGRRHDACSASCTPAGRTIVLITHDADVAAAADRQVHLRDGKIAADQPTRVAA